MHRKKGAEGPGLLYEQALDEALCYGWIDGLLRRLNDRSFILRYSPRKPGSIWSKGNKARVERLLREGRMTQAGVKTIEEGKASGQWEAAARRRETGTLPPDLTRALRARRGCLGLFRALPQSKKEQYIWWVTSAKRAETRGKRIAAVLDQLKPPRHDSEAGRRTGRKS